MQHFLYLCGQIAALCRKEFLALFKDPANRITLVQNGTVDIECGSTTNNTERQKQVAFSNTFFVIGTKLMAKAAVKIVDRLTSGTAMPVK